MTTWSVVSVFVCAQIVMAYNDGQPQPKKEVKVVYELPPPREDVQVKKVQPKKEVQRSDPAPKKNEQVSNLAPKKEVQVSDPPKKNQQVSDLARKKEVEASDPVPKKYEQVSEMAPKKDVQVSDLAPNTESPLHQHPTRLAMLKLNNDFRTRSGLAKQAASPELTRMAQAHALWMANSGRFQHDNHHSFLEIIYWNAGSVEGAFNGWLNSGSHRGIILSDTTHVGYGYAVSPSGQSYWCGIFGNMRDEPPASHNGD